MDTTVITRNEKAQQSALHLMDALVLVRTRIAEIEQIEDKTTAEARVVIGNLLSRAHGDISRAVDCLDNIDSAMGRGKSWFDRHF